MTRTLTMLLAVLACFGCGGAIARSDEEDHDLGPSAGPTPVAAGGTAYRPTLGRGTLAPLTDGCPADQWWLCENDAAARESICVSIAGDGDISAVDELDCRAAADDPDLLRCGACSFRVLSKGTHLGDWSSRVGVPWVLSGLRDSEECKVFGGTYEVHADASCGRQREE